jgi:hypothetical protein
MIPIDKINILNPRVRNQKVFLDIATNMTQVGHETPDHRHALPLWRRERLRSDLRPRPDRSLHGLRANADSWRLLLMPAKNKP